MTNQTDEPKKPNINADHNSNAVGSISAGGDISGNIHIGNVYQTPEDDVPLSSDEIENGLTRFAEYLPERAPVLQDSFSSIAQKLRATLGADQNSLSPALKAQREDGVDRMKLMCMEVTDISFRAMCIGQNPPPYDSRPPFLGLFAFRPEDREFFFGRDALVQKLVARIKAHPFLAVLGASGSGKSSLVMAGLVPALEAQMSYLTPSSAPLSQLLTAKESASAQTVFVIDQFEELFTHPHDAAERADFIHALLELTKTNRVVITMRADFWGEVAIYSDLKQAMLDHQELIAPMTVDELHSAMENQAAVVGLRFDPTLSESILAEVKGEPGAMPLLQHALWELWNRRHGRNLHASEYHAFGGVKQAITRTAEKVYMDCSKPEQDQLRDIFLRLTRLDDSEEGRDTRRRVPLGDLLPSGRDAASITLLLDKLANARLIVKMVNNDKTEVEVAHEALIRHWERLRLWLNEDRDNLRLRESVSEDARRWTNTGKDEILLNHRGGRLDDALLLRVNPRYGLTEIEQAYLKACVAMRNKEQREREQRLRWTVIASVMAAAVFLVLGSFGLIKSNDATAQAITAQANANVATTAQANAEIEKHKTEEQKNLALARQLAAQGQTIFGKKDSKQQTAVLLAVQSMNISSFIDAALVLQNNSLARSIVNMSHEGAVTSLAFSLDGKYLVSGSDDGTVRVWSAITGKETARMLHDSKVYSVDFSSDGKYVASGSADGTARVWEVITGEEIARMSHDYELRDVWSVAFSPDGKYVVSGSYDKTARVWETTTGKEIARINHDNWVTSVAFSPDGKYVISAGSNGSDVRVWEAITGHEIIRITEGYNPVVFSSTGKYIIFGGYNSIRIWNLITSTEIFRLPFSTGVTSFDISPDENFIVSGEGTTNIARVWDITTGVEVARITHDDYVTSVAFSPDGQSIVSGSWDGTAILWDAKNGMEITRTTHNSGVNVVNFSPDGKYVVSGSLDGSIYVWQTPEIVSTPIIPHKNRVESVYWPSESQVVTVSEDSIVHVWNYFTGLEVAHTSHSKRVSAIAFSLDGKYIITGDNSGVARVWESATGIEISHITQPYGVRAVAISSDGKYAMSGGCDELDMNRDCVKGIARVWESATGQEIAHMTYGGVVTSVAFSPDGRYIVSGSFDGNVHVWETATGKEVVRMTYGGSVYDVIFSPNGKYIISAGCDKWDSNTCKNGTAYVWDAFSGLEISHLTHNDIVSNVAISPNGKHIISAICEKKAVGLNECVVGVVIMWDVETGAEIFRVKHDGYIASAAFSPDGNYIVSGSADNTARVWDVSSGLEVARITHDNNVYGVAFSPDGKHVVSGSQDGTARIWLYRPEDLLAESCSRLTRNLTRAEWNQYIGDALPYQAVCPNLPIEAESTPTP